MENFVLSDIIPANVSIEKVSTTIPEHPDIHLSILRLDKIHPVVSGNKLFKLKYYLQAASETDHRTLLTFGGTYSNHLAATAYTTKITGLRLIACVRGEEGNRPSHTLEFCRANSAEIHFLDRALYRKMSENPDEDYLTERFGPHITVASGGLGIPGAIGAQEILNFIPEDCYSHICVPVGSATTLAGLLLGNRKEKILAFPALKGLNDTSDRIAQMKVVDTDNLTVFHDYHFGGFAKWNMELIYFLNRFYRVNRIPLDFVYTGKMVFAITDLITKGYFPAGSEILAIHTGGLQGNETLPKNLIAY
ncbi:MAG: hypothetical protein J5I50_00995 [Chitinophagaceae bacterium]|nr:hypothetical protein [Chitinophagaceae bacterium]